MMDSYPSGSWMLFLNALRFS